MDHPELRWTPEWCRTGSAFFTSAAKVSAEWWVLRINSFPDHPTWTLFIDGRRRFDLDDVPPSWGRPASDHLPRLTDAESRDAVEPIGRFVAYGREVGRPCDNPFCCG